MYGLGLVVFNLKTYRDFPFLISWWRFHELTIFPGKSALLPRRGYHLREKVRAKSLADCWLNVLLILFKIDSWMLVTSLSIFKNITHGVQHFRCSIGSFPASIHRFKEGLTKYRKRPSSVSNENTPRSSVCKNMWPFQLMILISV